MFSVHPSNTGQITVNAAGTQLKNGETLPSMDWSGDPVTAIARFCQEQDWLFAWDPVDPWIDIRWFAMQMDIGKETLRKNYTQGLPRMRTRKGIGYRASDINRSRASAPQETPLTRELETCPDESDQE